MQNAIANILYYIYLALFLPLIYITFQGMLDKKDERKANLVIFFKRYFLPMLVLILLLNLDRFASEAQLASIYEISFLMKYFLTDIGHLFIDFGALFLVVGFNEMFRQEESASEGVMIAHMFLAFGLAMGVWNISLLLKYLFISPTVNVIILYSIDLAFSLLINFFIYLFVNRKKRIKVLNEPVVLKVLVAIATFIMSANLYIVKFMDLANNYALPNIIAFSALILVCIGGLIYAIPKLSDSKALVVVGAKLWDIEIEKEKNPSAAAILRVTFIEIADNFKRKYPHLAGSTMLVPSF